MIYIKDKATAGWESCKLVAAIELERKDHANRCDNPDCTRATPCCWHIESQEGASGKSTPSCDSITLPALSIDPNDEVIIDGLKTKVESDKKTTPLNRSGGSDELAAIRERDAKTPDETGWLELNDIAELAAYRDRRTLLRMVDDLNTDREALGRKNTRIKDNLRQAERERDELRERLNQSQWQVMAEQEAKAGVVESCEGYRQALITCAKRRIDAEAQLSTVTQQLCEEARAHGETQAKLAVAEAKHVLTNPDARTWRRRFFKLMTRYLSK